MCDPNENTEEIELTEDQLDELMKRYYSKEKLVDLIKDFKLNIPISGVIKLFPIEVLEDTLCLYCNEAMSRKRPSRSALASGYRLPVAYCNSCSHKADLHCYCMNCRAIEAEKDQKLHLDFQNKITQIQHLNNNTSEVTDLSLKDAFYLVGLCRLARGDDTHLISRVSSFSTSLAPSEQMSLNILQFLYKSQLIDVSLSSPMGSIHFDASNKPECVNWRSVEWCLNLSKGATENIEQIKNIEDVIRKKELWPPTWEEELEDIWKELALHQCLKYLQVHVEDHGFEFRAGEKTRSVIKTLLEDFSILQSYYFIWVAAHQAASYYLRKNTSRRQAANMIVGDIQRRAERALVESWKVKEYSKDTRCGESVLTPLFSNVLTNLGDSFFERIPGSEFE